MDEYDGDRPRKPRSRNRAERTEYLPRPARAGAWTIADGVVRTAAEDYLEVQGERLAGRLSATAYRRLSESIDLHRVDPGAIACPVTLIAADSDQLVPIADVERLSGALSSASLHVITSLFGHDSFLKEAVQIDAILSPILSNLEEQP